MDEGGWASMFPTKMLGLQRPDASFQQMPPPEWWAGAKLGDPIGGLRGALAPFDLERGHRILTMKDGSTYNLGHLTDEQIVRVNQLTGQVNTKK